MCSCYTSLTSLSAKKKRQILRLTRPCKDDDDQCGGHSDLQQRPPATHRPATALWTPGVPWGPLSLYAGCPEPAWAGWWSCPRLLPWDTAFCVGVDQRPSLSLAGPDLDHRPLQDSACPSLLPPHPSYIRRPTVWSEDAAWLLGRPLSINILDMASYPDVCFSLDTHWHNQWPRRCLVSDLSCLLM